MDIGVISFLGCAAGVAGRGGLWIPAVKGWSRAACVRDLELVWYRGKEGGRSPRDSSWKRYSGESEAN
jgi:hypothetical protein